MIRNRGMNLRVFCITNHTKPYLLLEIIAIFQQILSSKSLATRVRVKVKVKTPGLKNLYCSKLCIVGYKDIMPILQWIDGFDVLNGLDILDNFDSLVILISLYNLRPSGT